MKTTDGPPTRLLLSSAIWCELLSDELAARYGESDPHEAARSILVAVARRAGWPPRAALHADGYRATSVADLEQPEDDPGDSALAAQLRRRPR